MSLSDVVQFTISTTNPGVSVPGFGKTLIATQEAPLAPGTWTTRTRTYSSLTGVAADWAVTTAAYAAAAAIFAQQPSVMSLRIGRLLTNPVAQQYAISVTTTTAGATYNLWITDPTGKLAATNAQVLASFTLPASVAWAPSTAKTVGSISPGASPDAADFFVVSAVTSDAMTGSGSNPLTTAGPITDNHVTWQGPYTSLALAQNDAVIYGLKAAVAALTGPIISALTLATTGSLGSLQLTLTATAAATWFGCEIADPTLLAQVQSHAAPSGGGLVTDLTAFANETTDWYGLETLLNSSAYIAAAAGWVETNGKLYAPDTCDTSDATAGTGPLATLKSADRARSGGIFHPRPFEFIAGAEQGEFFPVDPGGDNWRLKTLSGVTPGWGNGQQYTASQVANLLASNANFYYVLGGDSVIGGTGEVSSGEYIDVIRFLDWFTANASAGLADDLIQSNKVPFTDAGINTLEATLRLWITAGIKAGGINPGSPPGIPAPSVTAPTAGSATSAQRAARQLNALQFSFTLAGAINDIVVKGTVAT